MSAAEALLVRLAAADERSLHATLTAVAVARHDRPDAPAGLDRRSRCLVRLAAMLAVGAPRESVCWAADQASTSGADDDELAAVLLVIGPCARAAGLAVAGPRLAAALADVRDPHG
ncbi:MAG TPA: hypothetical protein VHX62_06075 [Solirubrobacteraceae bacterium]|nr:hypothetical protein [Solirubrobacteraceae bacterium]